MYYVPDVEALIALKPLTTKPRSLLLTLSLVAATLCGSSTAPIVGAPAPTRARGTYPAVAAAPAPITAHDVPIGNIDQMAAQIAALRSQSHFFRQIQWNNSLVRAIDESRRTQKPILMWVVGGNPGDERHGIYASAIREAVFADPEVIKTINRAYVPVMIRSSLFYSPGQLDAFLPPAVAKLERALYDRLRPAAPAQQGLCVLDSTGKPLSWVIMFSDRDNMLRYFVEALATFRNQRFAPSKMTERWSQYPNEKLSDAWPAAASVVIPPTIPVFQDANLSKPGHAPGSLTISITGRAVDPQSGKPGFDTIHAENYIEDDLSLSRDVQAALSEYLAASGSRSVVLPASFTQQLVAHAFLGTADMNPVANPRKAKVDGNKWELRATQVKATKAGGKLYFVKGTSRAAVSGFNDIDGGNFVQDVALNWDGYIAFSGKSIKRFVLIARGREKLAWRPDVTGFTSFQEFRELTKGRPIKMDGPVLFGFLSGQQSQAITPSLVRPKSAGKNRSKRRRGL